MKKILRWLILGGTLFFLALALQSHWDEVAAIEIEPYGWAILAIATGITLLAHTWSGWVWTWILKELNQPVTTAKLIQVYLKTNIAKYLPGNVGHYIGRVMGAKNARVTTSAATLSVLLEPLLMMAAALIMILFGTHFVTTDGNLTLIMQILGLLVVLCVIHPRFLNPVIRELHRRKAKNTTLTPPLSLKRYPLLPLLGELVFLGLRGTGFILTMFTLGSLNWSQIPLLLSAFSFSWLLGLIVPGAPGGLGVFEATAIALLQQYFPIALVISASGLYRLISIIAETTAAISAWGDERLA